MLLPLAMAKKTAPFRYPKAKRREDQNFANKRDQWAPTLA